jgi:hypothetical protein
MNPTLFPCFRLLLPLRALGALGALGAFCAGLLCPLEAQQPAGRSSAIPSAATAPRDIRVGTDVKTIAEAIKTANPGDTIHLEPKVYRDYAGFFSKKGLPGLPITLDGHGATLEGSEPLDPSQWREVSSGLFAADNLLPRLDDAIIQRWFFLMDSRVNRMGRTSKGRSVPLKTPSDLLPGEWTFVKDPSRENPASKQIYGTFFIKLFPGRTLAEHRVSVPVRSAGVQLGGDNAHLVVRNLTATHVYNDGFNIHGDCRDVVFENIRAIECGDDGISAHESAQYQVRDFVSMGNSTGICDTGTSKTGYERVLIRDCVGFDLYFPAAGRYRLRDVVVLSTAQQPLAISGTEAGACTVEMENVWIRREPPNVEALVSKTGEFAATRCTFENLPFREPIRGRFEDCLVAGKATPSLGAQGAATEALLKMIAQLERGVLDKPGSLP